MDSTDLYRHWVATRFTGRRGARLIAEEIERVDFSSTVGGGSRDTGASDFNTFAGDEVWTATVIFVDGRPSERIRMFDENPVSSLVDYARGIGETIEFSEDLSVEERLEREVRRERF